MMAIYLLKMEDGRDMANGHWHAVLLIDVGVGGPLSFMCGHFASVLVGKEERKKHV